MKNSWYLPWLPLRNFYLFIQLPKILSRFYFIEELSFTNIGIEPILPVRFLINFLIITLRPTSASVSAPILMISKNWLNTRAQLLELFQSIRNRLVCFAFLSLPSSKIFTSIRDLMYNFSLPRQLNTNNQILQYICRLFIYVILSSNTKNFCFLFLILSN